MNSIRPYKMNFKNDVAGGGLQTNVPYRNKTDPINYYTQTKTERKPSHSTKATSSCISNPNSYTHANKILFKLTMTWLINSFR